MTPRDDGVTVRRAEPRDAAALAELSGELGYPTREQEEAGRLTLLLASRDHRVLVADSPQGQVVGWIHAFIALRVESDPFVELGGLVVRDGWRGRGIGTALMDEAENWARRTGHRTLRLRSRIQRADAHRLYERTGWEKAKTQHVFIKRMQSEG